MPKMQIRQNIFETNSSSTHSISIKKDPDCYIINIPKDSKIKINGITSFQNCCYFDEMGKLNAIAAMLENVYYHEHPDEKIEDPDFYKLVSCDYFKWLVDIIKAESNSEIEFSIPRDEYNLVRYGPPYFGEMYDDNSSIKDILTENDDEILTNEKKFKERIKNIIYDPEIVINSQHNVY